MSEVPFELQRIHYVEFPGEHDGPLFPAVCTGKCARRDLELQKSPGNIVFEIPPMDRTQALLVVYDHRSGDLIFPPEPQKELTND